jgi:hypothetical protein
MGGSATLRPVARGGQNHPLPPNQPYEVAGHPRLNPLSIFIFFNYYFFFIFLIFFTKAKGTCDALIGLTRRSVSFFLRDIDGGTNSLFTHKRVSSMIQNKTLLGKNKDVKTQVLEGFLTLINFEVYKS